MSLERPSTRERQRGRVPMTVLDPAVQLLTGSSTVVTGTSGQQEQHTVPAAASSCSETWQPGMQQPESTSQDQCIETQVEAVTAQLIPLKVRFRAKRSQL